MKLRLILAFCLVLGLLATPTFASAACTGCATKTELNAVKKELNERITKQGERITALEAKVGTIDSRELAFEAATNTKLEELIEAVFPTEEPPVEEPPVEEPPIEEPPAEEEPTQTAHCFSNPAACGYPAPSTTGVPAGTTLTPSGSITASTAGQVVSGKDVTGDIEVLANNVTIENTRITQTGSCETKSTCGNYAIRINEGVTGTVIKNVETRTEAGKTCEHDIRNTSEGTVEVIGSYLHACDSSGYNVGTMIWRDTYSIAKRDISTDHVENVYNSDSTFRAYHDTMLNPVGQTAVVFMDVNGGSGGSCHNHLTVENSLLAGGGFTLYPCGNGTSAGTSSRVVKNNHFARCTGAEVSGGGGSWWCKGVTVNSHDESLGDGNGYYPNSGGYNIMAYDFPGPGSEWSGNVWDDNLAPISE